MTRFTRVKSTHQRIEGDSTSWSELAQTPAKDDTKNHRDNRKGPGGGSGSNSRGRGGGGGRGRGQFNGRGGPATGDSSNFQNGQRSGSDRRGGGRGGGGRGRRNNDRSRGGGGGGGSSRDQESANFTPVGVKGGNPNVRGVGATKSVKVFGNFWVGEDDARRLQGMAKKMKQEGVSRKEILDALQTDRRKAEKASKKRRDKTCFNCRQFGHVLSDCPSNNGNKEGGDEAGGEAKQSDGDICFKCGSTEHTSRFCKRKADKFSFAKCFVCSKSGHIARQCPSNQKGIYPAGGSCDECGSVTHLKKDCPDFGSGGGGGKGTANDPDAQVGRMADPFLSTEYEELPPEKSDLPEDEDMEKEKDIKEQERKQKFNKPSKNNKRKFADSSKESGMNSTVQENVSSPTKANPPKKRKVVKF